jgi:hypothetical protein
LLIILFLKKKKEKRKRKRERFWTIKKQKWPTCLLLNTWSNYSHTNNIINKRKEIINGKDREASSLMRPPGAR